MAYVISSQKGKDIAKDLKTNQTYEASDGSVWTKESDGSVTVRTNGNTYKNAYTPTSGGNSQYTGSSSSIITNNTTQQSIKDKMNANSVDWWSADEAGRKQLEAENKSLAALLGGSVSYNAGSGTWSGTAEGTAGITKDDILGWEDEYNQNNPKEDYQGKYDPQIDALLNEILNRDDFSYDVMNDPLYQQYAEMYRREGDRAMRDTLAEAAASAGGMNTYAITAAQQANSYYNSQLNDKIPELYQLAYQMYLQDKESKVQDLGILQNMDATQYSRYRDTINDWYKDKDFAYGAYYDAAQQGNWQANYDFNAMVDNRNFNNGEYWKNKEWDYNDYWTNKEYTDNRGDIEYDRNQNDKDSAKEEVWKYISLGVTPSADLIAKAGMTETDVALAVAAVKAEQASKGKSSGGSSKKKSVDVDDDEDDTPIDTTPTEDKTITDVGTLGNTLPAALPIHESIGAFQTIVNDCDALLKTEGKQAVLNYLERIKTTGAIDLPSYTILLKRYGN
jgi:hypothetical protein